MRHAALVVAIAGYMLFSTGWAAAPAELDRYNVVWTSPGRKASDAMPIGNGEVGLNLWVEEDGDLRFYLARTDTWSEACRLLKLGRVRVALTPNPFIRGARFRQELDLRHGRIRIDAGLADRAVTLTVFVDAERPVVHVVGESAQPLQARAVIETWRTERRRLTGEELQSSWTMNEAPPEIEVWESADAFSDAVPDTVIWYHQNESSVVPLTLRHQGLNPFLNSVPDPLVQRIFGGWMWAEHFARTLPNQLESVRPLREFTLRIALHTDPSATPGEWGRDLSEVVQESPSPKAAARRTASWWEAFWGRSWIFVEGDTAGARTTDAPPSLVTQAYVLQRWMAACSGRGTYPIKFNGSIFTVDPELTGGPKLDADWRRWGDCYWWQNTRLPYFAMLASGDFDLMQPLFRLYEHVLPICRARAKSYHDAQGVYFPETMTIFGTYANRDYGWDRTGRRPNEVLCPWWCYAWQQGLELTQLMLDYYDHTADEDFLAERLVPMAREVLLYFDSRFPRDARGRLVITPTQAVETYWYGVTNDTPTVAGLNAVLARLLALPAANVPAPDRAFWVRLRTATPALPIAEQAGRRFVPPAESFEPKRSNVENPELYAVWPFRLLGVHRPELEAGRETYHRRHQKTMNGWSYDGQCAALLGLAEEAKAQVLAKVGNRHPDHRFPAMWGPNDDWLPDQDHGSNLLLTLQHMLLVGDGPRIFLLPAWPRDWNVHFKLHAPQRTTVEGRVTGGKLVDLKVTPKSRATDVSIVQLTSNPPTRSK